MSLIWLLLIFTIIFMIPLVFIYHSAKNIGLANTMNGLSKLQDASKNIERVLKIIKHIIEQSKIALQDLKYVQNNIKKLQTKMTDDVLQRALEEGREVDLTEDEDRIVTIFKEKRLTELTEDFNKIADKCNTLVLEDWDTEGFSKLEKYFDMTDIEIVENFISKKDQEYCKDLAFVVDYIKKKN